MFSQVKSRCANAGGAHNHDLAEMGTVQVLDDTRKLRQNLALWARSSRFTDWIGDSMLTRGFTDVDPGCLTEYISTSSREPLPRIGCLNVSQYGFEDG